MRKVFAGLAVLLLLLIAAQFFFAATGAVSSESDGYRPHHVLGYVIFSVPLVMAAVAAFAKLPGRLIGMTVGVAGLTGFQVLIASVSRMVGPTAGPYVFGLHALGGMAMIGLALAIFRAAQTSVKPATA